MHFFRALPDRCGECAPAAALGCVHCEGSGCNITERTEPFPYAILVFRDPDNIQLELIWH